LLQQADIEGQWSKDDGRNATEKMLELLKFGSVLHVDVKLVGYDGDGNYGLKVDEADFLRYFETVLEEHEKEAMVLNHKDGSSHRLPLNRKFFFRVLKARKSLSDAVNERIRSLLIESRRKQNAKVEEGVDDSGSGGLIVPYTVVDDLIRKDYMESEMTQTHTIYLLNPKRVMLSEVEGSGAAKKGEPDGQKPVFKEGGEDEKAEEKEDVALKYWYNTVGKDAPIKGFSSCGTTMWAGVERYMWIDLTAGPISYGPHTSGDGLVSEFSVPHLDNFQVYGIQDHSAGSHPYSFVQEYLAEVVAIVGKTCDTLIEPSLHHFPVPLVKNLKLHLVHITNDPHVRTKHADAYGYIDGIPPCEPWDTIKRELGDKGRRITMQGQTLSYNRSVVQLNDCKFCLAAYAAAMRSHTSTVLRGTLKTQVHEYLDSKELHKQLLTFLNKGQLGFARDMGITGWRSGAYDEEVSYMDEWTVPVFVFDLQDENLILLDRFNQATSFPEMVVAVQTNSVAAAVDFQCTDEMVTMNPSDASRATLAALLQTVWGVAPTHEHFSGKSNKTEISYLWSTSRTPFGPFSPSTKLTFAIIDAAKRNMVYSALNASIAQVSKVMEQYAKFGKHIEQVLLPGEHLHFVRRWNVLKFKTSRTGTYLSLLNFNTALFYARSMRHDVKAIQNAVLRAGQFVHSYVGCLHDEKPSILSFLVYLFAGSSLVIMAYVLVHSLLARRRAHQFKKKL